LDRDLLIFSKTSCNPGRMWLLSGVDLEAWSCWSAEIYI